MEQSFNISQSANFEPAATRTLADWAESIVYTAESLYGPRDKRYTLSNIGFAENGPCIWYPPIAGHIEIRLGPNALGRLDLTVYQLAHECIHLLSPSGDADGLTLEEGLATKFSEDYVAENVSVVTAFNKHYASAAADVRNLLSIHPDAVKQLRAIEPAFYKMNRETFEQAGLLDVPPPLLDRLLMSFRDYCTN
ncbi:hypothetical protein SAMN04487926_1536 [Paraburkholderia steynii]|uniref:Uncharacterized protein n=1 Tax=Paraburkholderia steynii TaxID=1245441 RepID=A0A7Z7BKL7_9BURK|nr:hypothetical protein [Paraburkholderia steynii]SDJ46904.1 hypothetical protein SAMN04487926_1536 [Paraburkholderia steynii]